APAAGRPGLGTGGGGAAATGHPARAPSPRPHGTGGAGLSGGRAILRGHDMDLPTRITEVLTPHLGANTADAVARHLRAKHGVGEGPVDAATADALHQTIRRGLVAFVGSERAAELAQLCLRGP